MDKSVDVAVIGAGHAGLNAIKEIRKVTDRYVLINGGPLGTTCARVGCMPSKVAIHLAEVYQSRARFEKYGISGGDELQLNQTEALEYVRDQRDTFVDLVLANTTDEMDEDHLLSGYAEFVAPNTVRIGDDLVHANAFVVATGARSVVPEDWSVRLGDDLLTVDNLFEQETLPESIAVIGLGPIGIEIGQALHRMGVKVIGVNRHDHIARLSDPDVNRAAIDILRREFPLWLGEEPQIQRNGDGYQVQVGDDNVRVDKLFLALGRHANLKKLQLTRIGVPLDDRGIPVHDPTTLKVKDYPIYLAGDAAGSIATLQRAAKHGHIAGYNAANIRPQRYREHTPMSIIFTEPNIACVGKQWPQLDPQKTVIARKRFGPVGRAMIMGQNRGLLSVYADRDSQEMIGACMVGSRSEHLGMTMK